jgi:tetratricopeptide (TPR) repeat protein
MKKFAFCALLCCCVLGWQNSILATPMNLPGVGTEGVSGASPAIPAEVNDQFSRKELSTFTEKMLAIREAELRERIVKEPDNPALLHELGTVNYQLGLRKEAISLWTVAHKRDPNLTPPEVMTAVQEVFALVAKGKKDEAEQQLAAAEQQFAREPHFQLIKAEQAMRSRNFAVAEQAYRQAHELGPELYVTALNLARFYEFRQQDPSSIDRLYQQAIQLAPKKPEVWASLGAFQFNQKQVRKALDAFATVKSLDPDAPVPERRLADLSAAAGDYSGAEKWYREALTRRLTANEELLVRAALGDVLLRLGKRKEARQEIESVLRKKEVPPLVFALATIDETEGQLRQAEKGYRRVLELIPDNPLAANNLAMLLLTHEGSVEEALKLAQQARASIPNNLIIESTYGCALVQSGKYDDGIQILSAVVNAKGSQDAWAHYYLARALLATQRSQEAAEHFKQVLAIDPQFPRKGEVTELQGGTPAPVSKR